MPPFLPRRAYSSTLLATLVAGGCTSGGHQLAAEPAIPVLEGGLPPVIDASFADSAIARDRKPFACGTLRGAVTADLVCDRLFPDFDWDFTPMGANVEINVKLAPGATGLTASNLSSERLGVQVFTGRSMAPLTWTCANEPLLPSNQWVAFHSTVDTWAAGCNSPSNTLPGSSFELAITSVGMLTSDSLGADPIDASAATFDWATATREVISNSFHGTFKATLVASGRDPVYVSMAF
jgi:hypothetical protein